MSRKNEIADLYKELQDAVQADKLYWIRNDAKIRAVTTAQTYEEFRNRVEAAHLSPLTKEDKSKPNEGGRSSWNRAMNQ
ncbi:uncharacterized protein CBL_08709 [Carabus blaptoides fortunei]